MAYDQFTNPTASGGSFTAPKPLGTLVPTPSADPPISLELSAITNHLSELQMELDGLRRQLEPVMVPTPPTADTVGQGTGASSRGVVCDTLVAYGQRIANLKYQIVEMRQRLTV